MTVNEVVHHSIEVLGVLKIPVVEIENIGMPIAEVMKGLKICADFMDSVEQKARKKQAAEEEAKPEEAENNETDSGEERKENGNNDERTDV